MLTRLDPITNIECKRQSVTKRIPMANTGAPTFFPHLQNLDVSSNDMGEEGMEEFAPCLLSLSRLKTLNVSANLLGKEGMSRFAPSLILLTYLKELHINANEMGECSCAFFDPFNSFKTVGCEFE